MIYKKINTIFCAVFALMQWNTFCGESQVTAFNANNDSNYPTCIAKISDSGKNIVFQDENKTVKIKFNDRIKVKEVSSLTVQSIADKNVKRYIELSQPIQKRLKENKLIENSSSNSGSKEEKEKEKKEELKNKLSKSNSSNNSSSRSEEEKEKDKKATQFIDAKFLENKAKEQEKQVTILTADSEKNQKELVEIKSKLELIVQLANLNEGAIKNIFVQLQQMQAQQNNQDERDKELVDAMDVFLKEDDDYMEVNEKCKNSAENLIKCLQNNIEEQKKALAEIKDQVKKKIVITNVISMVVGALLAFLYMNYHNLTSSNI